jgi:hypothetical protein
MFGPGVIQRPKLSAAKVSRVAVSGKVQIIAA